MSHYAVENPAEPAGPFAKEATSAARALVDRRRLSGFVSVVTDVAGPLAFEAYGWADAEDRRPMRSDAVFWIASLTKPMTATAVLILADEGLVDLSAPLSEYLPEFRGRKVAMRSFGRWRHPKRPPTVEDLLRHLSGIPTNHGTHGRTLDEFTIAHKARIYSKRALEADPGSLYRYSNVGYELLGAVIEAVTGDPYERVMSERLFEPLRMSETTFRPSPDQIDRLAACYRDSSRDERFVRADDALLRKPFDAPNRRPTPSFGLFSTANDCTAFVRMFLDDGRSEGRDILATSTRDRMLKGDAANPAAARQGLGWMLGEQVAVHGSVAGSLLYFDVRRRLGLVFLTASFEGWGGPAAEAYSAYILALSSIRPGVGPEESAVASSKTRGG